MDRGQRIAEAVRVTRKGGRILFSTYSSRIWQDRLAWFRAQAGAGPLGEIDEARTAQGTIICKDGFKFRTVAPDEFARLFAHAGLEPCIREVDGSSHSVPHGRNRPLHARVKAQYSLRH